MTAMMAMMTIMSITVTVMMMEMMLRMTHGSGLPAGVCRIIHSLLPLTLATPVRHIVYTNWCIAVPTSIHLYQPITKQSIALQTTIKKKIALPTINKLCIPGSTINIGDTLSFLLKCTFHSIIVPKRTI